MKLYETLAQQLIKDIKAGRLPVGSRLPSLRELAKQNSISMTTANNTYRYLEETGWVYVRAQSGFYVASIHSAENQPAMPGFISRSKDPKKHAPASGYSPKVDFFNPLGVAMVAPELMPTLQLQRCIKRITTRSKNSLLVYPDPQGNAALRNSLAKHFRNDHFHFNESELVITNGCIDAVRHCIQVVSNQGDTIAISSPCYSGLLDLLSSLSRRVIEIPVNDQGLDMNRLERLMKNQQIKAGLFSTSHMNPSGTSLSSEQKQTLAFYANKYAIPMIEDDVYAELSHQGKPPLPMKHWDDNGYVLWCGSVSKTLAAGLRIGWCLPGQFIEPFKVSFQHSCLGVNGLTQACLTEFIQTGEYRTHINRMRTTLSRQVSEYRHFLRTNLPLNARISATEGGMVLWIQVPNLDASKLEKKAIGHAIDIRSGGKFSTHEHYSDCFRINCGWPLSTSTNNLNNHKVIRDQLRFICTEVTQNINQIEPQNPT